MQHATDSTSPLHHPKYRPDIDGLRAIAIVAVVVFHAFPERLRGGFIGVDIFFVISGFLISTIIFENLERGSFSFLTFYGRRIRRIFPALLLVLGSSFLFGAVALYADEYTQLSKHIVRGAGFVLNFSLWQESGYFDAAAETKPLLHLWSLAIEEQFYILWPLLLWAAWQPRWRRWALALVVIVAAIALSFGLNIWQIQRDPVAAFYAPQTRFWELLIGALLAHWTLFSRRKTSHVLSPSTLHTLASLRSIVGVGLIAAGLVFVTPQSAFPGWWALLPTCGAALVISAGSQVWLNRVVLSHPLLVWLGLISFPLYLWHWPLLSFAHIMLSTTPSATIRLAALLLAVVLAWLTYRWIERPIRVGTARALGMRANAKMTIKTHLTTNGITTLITPALIAGMMIVAGIAALNEQKKGLLFNAVLHQQDVKYPGDIGHVQFHQYPYQKFFLCTPLDIRQQALKWGDAIRCFQSQKEAVKQIALIGDSHAEHLFIGLAEAVPSKNWVFYVHNSLPVIGNPEFARIFDYVVRDADIHTVILSAYWFTKLSPTDPHATINDGANLRQTVLALTAAHKEVYVADDLPDFNFDPHKCQYERYFSSGCVQEKRFFDTEYAAYLPKLEAAIRDNPHAHLLRAAHYLCDAQWCSMERDGLLLYRDNNHLNINGSRYLGARIARDVPALVN